MTNEILEALAKAAREPTGYSRLREFCDQVESGETPDSEFLQVLAGAFRQLMRAENRDKGLRAFAAAMDLKRKAGRKTTAIGQDRQFRTAIKSFILELNGASPTEAVNQVAEEFSCTDPNPKYVWDARRDHGEDAELMARYILKIRKDHKNLTRDFEEAVAFAENINQKNH
jgi:hypothetical protein